MIMYIHMHITSMEKNAETHMLVVAMGGDDDVNSCVIMIH